MPSLDLLLHFQEDLVVKDLSFINGMTYSRTLEAWLQKMDAQSKPIRALFKVRRCHTCERTRYVFQETYGKESETWFVRWRLFYIACSELFGYKGGEEWGLAHVLMEKY